MGLDIWIINFDSGSLIRIMDPDSEYRFIIFAISRELLAYRLVISVKRFYVKWTRYFWEIMWIITLFIKGKGGGGRGLIWHGGGLRTTECLLVIYIYEALNEDLPKNE